jgi:hypothetical protein
MAARGHRDVFRNYTYIVFGLGLDAVIVICALIGLLTEHANALAVVTTIAALAPFLALGVRAALIRVVIDARGVRVVNMWRTHRVHASEAQRFVVNQRNLERFGRWGRFQAFLSLVCLHCTDGREINASAVSAGGSLTEAGLFVRTKLPGIVEDLNRAGPPVAEAVRAGG